ncbi:MAG TPA: Crp/Fnr family transcriptional regulator [Candidatus Limnocylindria bacterium]|jgi:CRP/FNR family cyclic AMP-dependent transcriptional regulator|nr:Crp/Fnr family transcriptional regulator [Candidatus Limnocylindria bacterium]
MSGLGEAIQHLAALRRDRAADDDANKVWYLQRNRLFAEATESEVARSEHLFTMCEMARGTHVFDQGDPTRVIYLVKRGAVRIARETEDGKDVTVALLGPGDLFGEETLFDAKPRTTNAIVVEDALLCQTRAEDLFALLSRDPALALNVAKVLSGQLDEARATMEDLAYAKVSERILHLLRKLAAEHGVPCAGGTRIDLRLTHADIASLVGSTRETVSLELGRLVEARHVRVTGRTVVLLADEETR